MGAGRTKAREIPHARHDFPHYCWKIQLLMANPSTCAGLRRSLAGIPAPYRTIPHGSAFRPKLVFTILSAVAEAERDRIRERVCDVKRDQKERHRFLGGTVPFGWKLADDGLLVEDAQAQAAIATMREARAAGRSLRHCAELVRERHGLDVSHMTVKRVLGADRTAA
jgi:DNA invertase Pin-like site-specific DNA recombinase